MYRINLNKYKIFVGLFGLLIIPNLAFPSDPIFIQDAEGNPIPHALVKIGTEQVLTVGNDGSFELPDNLQQDQLIEIIAMGYDTRIFQARELRQVNKFNLKEKIGQMGEVVVAATRTDRSVEDLPMPVTIITRKKIAETGGMRLSEILREQTGLQVVGDHGTGLQMQGLSSDYILILLDGEPLIGRTAGTFDLDRIAVSNIERIEVLRGPSSAIYGSETMAGAINIITKKSKERFAASLESRYRSFNTLDLSGDIGMNQNDWNIYAYFNRFSTDGFDITPEVPGKTQSPYEASTAQFKIGKKTKKWDFKLYSRFYNENSENSMPVAGEGNPRLADL